MSLLTRMSRVTVVRLGFALIFIALAAVAWLFILSPRFDQADKVVQDTEDLELANLGLVSNLNRTRDMLQDAPAVAQQAQELLAKMPQTADLPAVLDQITDAAGAAGIAPNDVSSIATSIPVPVAEGVLPEGVQLAQMSISLSARGSREQVAAFLDNLQALDRSLLITATQVTDPGADRASSSQTLQVSGEMFVLQSRLPDLVATVESLLTTEQASAS